MARSFGPAAATLTGFTLGHSVTLALGALDVVRVTPAGVEALIAGTIFCVGLGAARVHGGTDRSIESAAAGALGLVAASALATGVPVWLALALAALILGAAFSSDRPSAVPWRRPFAFAAGFGTIHGLAFAETLREAIPASGGLIAALLGFNLGVEAGQIFVASLAAGAYALLRRRRPDGAAGATYVTACLLLFGGAVWMAARLPFA
jgi:hypothetical protein